MPLEVTGHEGGALINEVSVLLGRDTIGAGMQTKKRILTKQHIYWHLGLGLLSFQC